MKLWEKERCCMNGERRHSVKSFLQPEDDGLPTRRFGRWVTEKLYYLQNYIEVFETSMRNQPWRRRIYVDLFAGSGKCVVKESGEFCLGSPLLALTTKHPFTDYFFVDSNPQNIDTLRKRCSATDSSANIHYIVGDGNVEVKNIVAQIHRIDQEFIPNQWSSLNLAFLDPDGLELEWETIATLAKVNRMDLIVHYSQQGLTRNLERFYHSDEETVIDRFFGDRGWRDIYSPWRKRSNRLGLHRELIDYYKSRLQDLGYQEVLRDDETGAEPLIRNAKRKAPLYRLLFASKHPLGHKFWKAVTRRDVYGQAKLF
ncbi:MAG: three-Cys-motif partner protein TcmP [Caldilineae bacterium]|nr:MAG: three-Cys-motif partner protein TcmP [Caldilineae bacterium]